MVDFNIDSTIKRNNGFVFKEMGSESVLIELVNNVVNMDKVVTLNELGTYIYSQLNEAKSVEHLLELIVNEFDIDKETAQTDLIEFLNDALRMKIVVSQ